MFCSVRSLRLLKQIYPPLLASPSHSWWSNRLFLPPPTGMSFYLEHLVQGGDHGSFWHCPADWSTFYSLWVYCLSQNYRRTMLFLSAAVMWWVKTVWKSCFKLSALGQCSLCRKYQNIRKNTKIFILVYSVIKLYKSIVYRSAGIWSPFLFQIYIFPRYNLIYSIVT